MQDKILNKKIVREVKSNFTQYLSLILIALLSIALFTGLLANYLHFKENVDSFYKEGNMADLFVTVNNKDNEDEIYLTNLDGVEDLSKRFYTNAYYDDSKLVFIATDDEKFNTPITIDGNKGVLISEVFANSHKLEIGDTIDLSFDISPRVFFKITNDFSSFVKDGKSDILNEEKLVISLEITGLMSHSEATTNLGNGTGILYLNNTSLKQSFINLFMSNYTLPNYLNIGIEKNINDADFTNQYLLKTNIDLKETIDNYFYSKEINNLAITFTKDTLPTNQNLYTDVLQAKQLLFVFPVIFYIVGVLIIITSLSKFINKDRNNIGIMSSLGFTKNKIILHYAKFSFFLTLIGGILGVIIGPSIIPSVMNQKYKILYCLPEANHQFFYLEYLISFVVLFIISTIISVSICKNVLKEKPVNIVRNVKSNKFKGLFVERFPKFFKKFSISIRMSLRNIKRNFSRSLMVIIGVMGCSALLVCGFGIDDTLNHGIDSEINEYINYDLRYSFDNNYNKEEIKSINNIDYVEEYYQRSIMAVNKDTLLDTTLTVIIDDSRIFNFDYDDKGASITSKVADDLNVKKGSKINFTIGSNEYEVTVNHIVELSLTQGIYISESLISELYEPNKGFALIKDSTLMSETKDELNTLNYLSDVSSKDDLLEMADNALSGIRIMTLTVKIFAILLAIVVIYNLAQLNFKERVKDIATLKVLGFKRLEISKTLLYEILLLTLVGSLLGLLLGMPMLRLVLGVNETPAIAFIYHINFVSYVYAILLTLGVSVFINLILSRFIDKVKMVESLKSVE